MRVCMSDYIRKLANRLAADEYGESVYLNIPYYQQQTDPSDPSEWIQSGPPSMYNDTDKSDRLKNKEDIRRQGPRPGPIDPLYSGRPVTVTVFEEAKTDEQGEPRDNVPARGTHEDLNRDTIGFNPGQWDRNDVGESKNQRALYRDTGQNTRY